MEENLIIVKASMNSAIRSSGLIPESLYGFTVNTKIVPKSAIIEKLMIDPKLVKGEITLIEMNDRFLARNAKIVSQAHLVISSTTHFDHSFTEDAFISKLQRIPRFDCEFIRDSLISVYISLNRERNINCSLSAISLPEEIVNSLRETDYAIGLAINRYLANIPKPTTIEEFKHKFDVITKEFNELKELFARNKLI